MDRPGMATRVRGDPPRLVASDLDGTLVRSDGTISARTRAALAAVERAGVPLVLVTGRPPRWMSAIAAETGHRGVAVCANGAVVWDLERERVVREDPVPVDVARTLVAALRERLPGSTFAVDGGSGFGHEPAYEPEWETADKVVADLDELLREPRAKLLLRHAELDSDALLELAREVVRDLATLTHSTANGRALVEISAAGITKATGLARVAEQHGVAAEDVVAFGDMPNDLPMLGWAGRSYAVANAHPEVIDAADQVTASNDDDGVARVLEQWFD